MIIEARVAHTEANRRHVDDMVVVETCPDSVAAFRRYRALHAAAPERELYFVSTERRELEIYERTWTGIRWTGASHPQA